jgi:hypothetical protein
MEEAMQKRYLVVLSLLALATTLGAQEPITDFRANQNFGQLGESYPLCGAPSFREEEQAALKYGAGHPELYAQMKLQKTTAWNFVVGSQRSWYSTDLRTRQRYLTPATCRAVGTNCYIFVEDAVWLDRVSQSAVDAIRNAFDNSTPANASKGIFQTDIEAFGNPPNIDNDAKIIIFILDIRDQYTSTGSGGFTVGYFTGTDQQPTSISPQSNVAEMLYIDANPLNLNSTAGLREALATTAHEFQHMIHWNYDQNEITFVNEGCSLVAEVHCGYPIYPQSGYVNDTNVYLFNWSGNDPDANFRDYSRAARFMTYIRDQIGIGVFKQIVQTPADGPAGMDAALQAVGSARRVNDIFVDWAIANALDDRNVNQRWGYTYPNLPKPVGRFHGNPNVAQNTRLVQNFGIEYLNYRYGANLLAKVTTTNPSLLIRAVELGASSKRVVDVTSGADFAEPDYGNKYQQIYFVVINTDGFSPRNYSYQSSGTTLPIELKWDETEPAGFLRLAPSDTVCVLFDGIPGAKLDSIRVALRRKGEITGGVWQWTGLIRPTPLGKRLAYPIKASTNFDTPVVGTPPTPYPIPYPNWRKVDLGSFNINVDNPFAVAFVIRVADTPGVMITRYPGLDPLTSFTYLTQPSSGLPNWYYLTADEANIWIYLIRAYVSFPSITGVKETVELEPKSFVLAQNYPNPFNPSTTIEFSLPKTSYVTLKVYNAIGEEISTLVAEKRLAGKHTIAWNAAGLPSGVYFYRLQGDGFVESKKLVLMK